MRLHESKLLMKEHAGRLIADTSVNPSRRTVYYLHKKWSENHFGSDNPIEKLKTKVKDYAKRGKKILAKGHMCELTTLKYNKK